ncbi:MAG: hypothetical protein IH819_12080 [Bacteroidetes bacterium]|nr:hypothetical protein [Bacteroidota bacterium]
MKTFIQSIIITTSILITSFAQPSASFNFTTAIPMGDFKNYNSNVGFGGNMEFFFFSPSERTPYGLGINLSYVSYGIQFFVNPYSDELGVSLNKANNFASVHILFQIAPHTGTVRPYIETLFGGSYIFSLTEVGYDYYSPATLWIDDWAWSYGGGVGLKLFATGNPLFDSGSTYIDFKVRYLLSTEVTYLDRNSFEYYGEEVYYSLSKSKTDMLLVSIGFFFFF